MEIVFVRHGESTANKTDNENFRMFCGRFDCELTELGKKQAESLKGCDAVSHADAVFVSPLKRTLATANAFIDRPFFVEPRIIERSLGDFEGHGVEEMKQDPRYDRYFKDPEYSDFRQSFVHKAPNGESYADVEKRVREFLDDVSKKDYRKIVVVSHCHAIRCMLKIIEGLSEEETFKFPVRQCSPIVVNIETSDMQ